MNPSTLDFFLSMIYRLAALAVLVCGLSLPGNAGTDSSERDSVVNALERRLSEVHSLRVKDSLKIDLLTQELKLLMETRKIELRSASAPVDSVWLQQKAEIEQLKAKTKGEPVVFYRDTLFYIHTSLGPYQVKERVADVEKKMRYLYEIPFFYPDSIQIRKTHNLITIQYQEQTISGISTADGIWADKDIDSLAVEHRDALRTIIAKYRSENSLKNNLIRVGELSLILLIVIALVVLINRLFGYVKNLVETKENRFLAGVRIRNYELIKREHISIFMIRLLDLLRILAFLMLFFMAMPLAFSIFPSTLKWAGLIREWFWDPLRLIIFSIAQYLPNLITIGLILVLARYTIRLFRFFATEIERGALSINGFHKEWAGPTYALVRFLLLMLTLVIIFPYLPGSGSDAFKGMSVFLGILISIGSSSAVSNAVAGLVITYMRPFQSGDWIKTGDITGVVIEKNALVTRLRTINNEDVSVPNSAILSGHTVNYSSLGKRAGLTIGAHVRIRYDYSHTLIESLLIHAALRTQDVAESPHPYVFQLSLEEAYAIYELNAYTFAPDNMYQIKSDLIRNIQTVFAEAKVELASTRYIEIKGEKPGEMK